MTTGDWGSPVPEQNESGLSTWAKVGIIALVIGLVASLTAGAFLYVGQNTLKADIASLQEDLNAIYDGELDFSSTLVDDGTTELIRQSVRTAVFRYADAEGQYVVSNVTSAIIISDEYVLVPASAIPPEDSGFTILAAGMFSSYLDSQNGVEEFDLSELPLIDYGLGLAALRRPADLVIDAVPLAEKIGDVREVRIDTLILGTGTAALSVTGGQESGGQFTSIGKVDIIAGQRILTVGLGSFQPVYVLRDGVPEVIGIALEGQQGVVPVVTFFELEPLFSQLGIQINFPE